MRDKKDRSEKKLKTEGKIKENRDILYKETYNERYLNRKETKERRKKMMKEKNIQLSQDKYNQRKNKKNEE